MKYMLIGLALASALSLTAPSAVSAAPAVPSSDAIDGYVRRAMDATGLPGLAVVVTHQGKVVHAGGYGRDGDGRAVTADTPMRVASVSKSFTAMAVMTLVDEGKVTLDEAVARQLPEFRLADPRAATVTVRQLLNQTSGLSDRTVDIGATEDAGSLRDYVATLRTGRLRSDPGTRWEYCNANYNVAARLVEVASGQPFGQYMQQRVFGPLGMTRSAVSDRDVHPANGFNSIFGLWVPRPELPAFLDGSGSGGVITTARDMGDWLTTQTGYGKRLVTPRSLETMHAPSRVRDYGMGWGAQDGLLVHAGNLFTYNAAEAIDPATGYGFAVMTNGAALYDPTYEILTGLVALTRAQTPATPGSDRLLYDLILAAISLTSIALGTLGTLRARRWATRRTTRPAAPGRSHLYWRAALRLIPVLLPALILALYPTWVSILTNGRTITWAQLTYFAAPLTITLTLAAAAGLATATTRLIHLRQATPTPTPEHATT
ncbi:serine hydrolase domain-containing protein [Nonomuraea sp. NPDC050536]|uniref:serine hydrolase domain-containing protein n=1 Tax=Nonomuraea sp. NPDC050536 TaxID=3364366 RepID=UPI0037CCAB82